MNGNFEFAKESYPYSGLYTGSGVRIVHIPTQEPVYARALPKEVAAVVALRLNLVYHSKSEPQDKAATLNGLLQNIESVVVEAAHEAHNNKLIAGNVLQQIVDWAVGDTVEGGE